MIRLALPVTVVLGIVTLGIAWGAVVSEPAAVHGHQVGSGLYCDDGYRNDGAQCVALPRVANGGYLGNTLYCHDGYYNEGTRCIHLQDVVNGGYLGATVYCNDGFYANGTQCVQLPALDNGTYIGDVRVCNDSFAIQDDLCIKSRGPADVWKRFDPATLARSRFAAAPTALDELFADASPSILHQQSSGSKLDAAAGSSYRWDRRPDGTTTVYGAKFGTKASWRTTIQTDGSMRGVDRNGNIWRYKSSSGLYLNLGTGKLCVGKGPARSCF